VIPNSIDDPVPPSHESTQPRKFRSGGWREFFGWDQKTENERTGNSKMPDVGIVLLS
jgi:hypothetical protein